MPRITAITPSKRDLHKVVITVDGRRVATLAARLAEELGLGVDQEWDDAAGEAVAWAVRYDRAMTDANRRLNRRDLSRATLRAKLAAGGHDAAAIERVVDRLTELGAVNDERLGRAIIDELKRKRPAGAALVRTKLRQAGLEKALVERLISEEAKAASDPADDAEQLARDRLRTMRDLPMATQQRRIASLLARRGFDEETIETTLARLGLDELS